MTLIQRNPWSNGVVYHFKVSTVNIQPQSSPSSTSLFLPILCSFEGWTTSQEYNIYTNPLPNQPNPYHSSNLQSITFHIPKKQTPTQIHTSLSLSYYDFIMAKTESGSPCRKKARRWVEPHYTHQFPVPHISRLNERSRDSLNRNNLRPRKYRNVDRIWKQHVSNHQTSLGKSRANTKPRDSKNDPRLVRPEPDTRRR